MPSFLDRLFGRGPKDHGPRTASASDDWEDDGEDDDADEGARAEARYLEFIGGTSAKFYAAVLHETDDDAWTVSFNFGRIGHPRDWATKIEDVDEDEAREVFDVLVDEKLRGGYERKPWPAALVGPDGVPVDDEAEDGRDVEPDVAAGPPMFLAASPGRLPAQSGGVVAGVPLPDGVLLSQDGDETAPPVIWISVDPVREVDRLWPRLAAAFPDTGLWPLIMELEFGPDRLAEMLVDQGSPGGGGARAILSRWWGESVADGDEFDRESVAPFGRRFPGLAAPTPGTRPGSLDPLVEGLEGHLGLVAVRRPADILAATGWIGAANYDLDPADMSTVLRSWEDRFDAYVVGLGWAIMTVAVGRPARTEAEALGIAAEHMAFCPDNIWQGVGTVSEYGESLVDATLWPFWWD
jgi:predicted DNA-binding WGR domain protein